MNAFKSACQVETEAMSDIVPFISRWRFVLTDKGRLSKEIQKQYGDAMCETAAGLTAVEFKAEEENKHGNLFLETWSNRKWFTPGWMLTLNADLLLYYFLADRSMFSVPFNRLREWAFHEGHIYRFPERQQNKRNQLNDTWGRCVPIDVLRRAVNGFKEFRFSGEPGNHHEVNQAV